MKKKRAGLVLTSLLVVAVIAVGLTLALLSTSTGTKTNAFSSNKNIDIQLREDQWDGYTFNDGEGDSTTGQTVNPAYEGNKEDLGLVQAQSYLPGQVIPKNPTVKNNNNDGKGVETNVALKVTYYLENEDGTEKQVSYGTFKETLLAENGIEFDESWKNITEESLPTQIFLYNKTLDLNEETTALFSSVPLSKNIEANENGELPKFNIKVQAYAIQAGVEGMNIETEMVKFINSN